MSLGTVTRRPSCCKLVPLGRELQTAKRQFVNPTVDNMSIRCGSILISNGIARRFSFIRGKSCGPHFPKNIHICFEKLTITSFIRGQRCHPQFSQNCSRAEQLKHWFGLLLLTPCCLWTNFEIPLIGGNNHLPTTPW